MAEQLFKSPGSGNEDGGRVVDLKLTVDPVLTDQPVIVTQGFWIVLEKDAAIGDVKYLCLCLRDDSFPDLGELPDLFSCVECVMTPRGEVISHP